MPNPLTTARRGCGLCAADPVSLICGLCAGRYYALSILHRAHLPCCVQSLAIANAKVPGKRTAARPIRAHETRHGAPNLRLTLRKNYQDLRSRVLPSKQKTKISEAFFKAHIAYAHIHQLSNDN